MHVNQFVPHLQRIVWIATQKNRKVKYNPKIYNGKLHFCIF